MYFYHPDHLGSITMITDGRGNVLAGGERGGKSHITYRPYGEILRTDSFGPDISKYKYTGQEEDRESGLMYYKARYYDSKIGRFLQQDSMAFPNQIQGMNRMMYVEGNPVSYRDESGNNAIIGQLNAIMKHMMGSIKIGDKIGRSIGRGLDYSMRKAGRGIDGAARQLASGGKYSRNKGNDLDHILGTRRTFAGIENSNLGDWITKQYNDIRTKPFELNDKRALRKTEDKHKVRSLACAAYFGFGTSGFADCFIRSYAMRTKQRTDIKKKTRWYPGEDHETGDPLVELGESEYVKRELLITYNFRCGIPSEISTPHCPSKQEIEDDKGDEGDE
jgi:RHS repeat-associated protein